MKAQRQWEEEQRAAEWQLALYIQNYLNKEMARMEELHHKEATLWQAIKENYEI